MDETKCPNCGAKLIQVNSSNAQPFCEYCGYAQSPSPPSENEKEEIRRHRRNATLIKFGLAGIIVSIIEGILISLIARGLI